MICTLNITTRVARVLVGSLLLLACTARADSFNILITSNGFSPAYLEVPVGATVFWLNQDSVTHSSSCASYPWDLGPIAPGYIVYMDTKKAGTFLYVDDSGQAGSATLVVQGPALSQPVLLQGGYFMFTMNNLVAGETLNVEVSPDLVHWSNVLTRVVTLAPTDSFIDNVPASLSQRFYRISVALP